MKKSLVTLFVFLFTLAASADILIYTDRSAELMDPLVELFEQQTGENAVYLTMGSSEVVDRLLAEGDRTLADIVIVKDMLYLNEMANLGLLQPMTVSTDQVPAQMQHPDKLWAALTMRARTVVYNVDLVDPEEVKTYASLGDEKWRGQLCLRTSQSSYNVSLISGFIADLGYDGAKSLMQSWLNNLSGAPKPNDRAVIDAVAQGECSVGVVNSYYLGQENAIGNSLNVGIVFVDQEGLGVHVNGTGAGIVAVSEKEAQSNQFMNIMLSSEVQYVFSNAHFDYPVNPNLLPETLVANWGSFFSNETNWSVVGDSTQEAYSIIEELGYK
jgi:iron(III) transport system substrate-binding protein